MSSDTFAHRNPAAESRAGDSRLGVAGAANRRAAGGVARAVLRRDHPFIMAAVGVHSSSPPLMHGIAHGSALAAFMRAPRQYTGVVMQ